MHLILHLKSFKIKSLGIFTLSNFSICASASVLRSTEITTLGIRYTGEKKQRTKSGQYIYFCFLLSLILQTKHCQGDTSNLTLKDTVKKLSSLTIPKHKDLFFLQIFLGQCIYPAFCTLRPEKISGSSIVWET